MNFNIINVLQPVLPNKIFDGNTNNRHKYQNLAPLKHDTVSFKGASGHSGNTQKVKKTDFKGIDLAAVEKFRVNISGFESADDLQTWAKNMIDQKILHHDFSGRQNTTTEQRAAIIDDWFKYVTQENEAYTPVMQYMILDAVTKDLKPNTDNLPSTLNKAVLASTMTEAVMRWEENPKEQISLSKLYRNKLRAFLFGGIEKEKSMNNYTGWIVIPSKKHSPDDFEQNVEKLKALSHNNWCTKSFNAKPYLERGDFHVYLENGEPKVGVRFDKDEIQEIQGEKNNNKIPQRYLSMIEEYIGTNDFDVSIHAEHEISDALDARKPVREIIKKIGEEAIKNNDIEKILPAVGIDVRKDTDGMYIVSSYHQPSSKVSFDDLGVNEVALFNKIKEIEGNADLDYSSIYELKNLKTVGGSLFVNDVYISDLGSLESIGGDVSFSETYVTSLGNLNYIGGNVCFVDSYIYSLDNLRYIGGNADFRDTHITNLDKLEFIGGHANFKRSDVADLGALKKVGNTADFSYTKIQTLKNLKSINNDGIFVASDLEDLGALKEIGGDADFSYSRLKSLGDLSVVGGRVSATDCPLSEFDILTQLHAFDDVDEEDFSYYLDNYYDQDRQASSPDDFETFMEAVARRGDW